ncbi:unnamed protein product [Rotaria socialis]|uniref:RHD domain-containing protein n=5 Tax=Rotaria socialis TaxID=392032 RepID=A0A818JU68_9BILA|nr:unnamed protein product [Rotaria socialis]
MPLHGRVLLLDFILYNSSKDVYSLCVQARQVVFLNNFSLQYLNVTIFTAFPFYSTSFENPRDSGLLEIIGQSCYTSKLRYRSDYVSKIQRRGVLHSTNNPNYQYPTIRIPRQYMIPTDEHYICISLVTVEKKTTKYRYVHPYEPEDVDNQGYHDRSHNSIWYSIQIGDIDGIKSFPNLRIVKKKADDLKNYGNLQVFNCLNNESSSQLLSIKDTIKEFNLEKAQLAISIGKKATNTNDNDTIWIIYHRTTVFSDELIQQFGKESYANCTPSGTSSVRFNSPEESDCRVHKYAPKFGYADSSDEILIFYKNRLQLKKYGELQVTFEFEGLNDKWTEPALELEVIDRMVSFRAPIFPFLINCATTVNIILTQKTRLLETLKFDYIPRVPCQIPSPSQILSSSSNSMSSMEHCYFDEIDDLIRSSRHSATPAITNSSKVDYTTRNTTDKPQNIRLDNTRDQLKIFSARLARVEQSATPTPDLLQVNQYRSRTQLAIAHSQINNNQSASHSTQPLPLMSTQSSNNHPLILVPHVLPDQLTRTHSRSSVFIRI